MSEVNLSPKKKILLGLFIGLVGLLLLEAAARILTRGPKWANPRYVEISKDFEYLDDLIADNQISYVAPKYYDEFLYATIPSSTTHVNFTDYYSARWTPDSAPLSEAKS